MIRTAAGFALLLSSALVIAQNSPPSGVATFGVAGQQGEVTAPQMHSVPEGTIVIHPTIAAACPIDMHATQGVWDHRTVRVRDGERDLVPHGFGQRISLKLKDSRPARIVAATLRVHGLNGRNGILPTPAETAPRSNAVRTMKVKFTEERDGTVSTDLWVGGFTSVTSIQLIDVSYSDGSVWTISRSNACRVQPDPLMLIPER
jgi:hypothetical protein